MTEEKQTVPGAQQEAQQVQPQVLQENSVSVIEEDEKFFAALGYFAFLFVIPLVVKPKSAYCKFHAKQSMVLLLIAVIVLIILAAIPWFGSMLTMALFAVYILAIYKAYKGEYWRIPVVSNFAGKMNVENLYSKAGLAVTTISGMKEKASGLAEKASAAAQNLGKQEGESAEQTDQMPNPPKGSTDNSVQTAETQK